MANFTAGTTFTDGVTNDVTAAKLNALIADAVPTSNLSLNSTTGTISNFTASTANITLGTIPTLTAGTTTSTAATITSATITTGTIPTLVATTLVTTGTGTAASPAIVPTGDTNTGLFFPAADTIAFSEGGTESMRIDSSGNVLVGATSITGLTPSSSSKTLVLNSTDANLSGAISYVSNGTAKAYHYVDSDGLFAHQVVSNNGQKFYTNNTERLRIDSSGNVGIGTPSQADTNNFGRSLDIRSSTGAAAYFRDSDDASKYAVTGFFGADSNAYLGSWGASTGAVIYTSGTERLRITSGGEVYIAGTTDQGAYNLQVNGTGVWGAGAYVNGSDSRIKEDIQPIASGLDVVEKLNPVTYKYKETWSSDQSIQSGFIAQELLTALDGQIYAGGVVQQGGAEGYYSVAYQNLIAVLTKAIQELKSENDSLKARVAALEAA